MNRRVAGAFALVAVLTLGACGTTYVDTEVTVPDTSPGATTTTLPPVDPSAPIDELLAEIETLMFDLDERIIERSGHTARLERIQDVWFIAERQIRADDPDDVFNFQQAIDLAESGVEGIRPADASKGYKIIADVIDDYLDRA